MLVVISNHDSVDFIQRELIAGAVVKHTALFLAIWKPSLLAPIKSFFRFFKKLRQEFYGKSDWPLTGFFTIWERPPAGNNRTLRPIRNGTATSAVHWVVSLSSIWIVTSLRASVGSTDAPNRVLDASV